MIKLNKTKRPISVTISTIILFLLMLFGVTMLLRLVGQFDGYDASQKLYSAMAAFYSLYFICAIGFWFMKRWAVYLYITLMLVQIFASALFGGSTPIGFLVQLIVLVIVFKKIPSQSKAILNEEKIIEDKVA